MPPLEGSEEEVKERKGLKILTPNKLTIRLPILLVQKSWKQLIQIKNKIRQIIHLLYHYNKIIKKLTTI